MSKALRKCCTVHWIYLDRSIGFWRLWNIKSRAPWSRDLLLYFSELILLVLQDFLVQLCLIWFRFLVECWASHTNKVVEIIRKWRSTLGSVSHIFVQKFLVHWRVRLSFRVVVRLRPFQVALCWQRFFRLITILFLNRNWWDRRSKVPLFSASGTLKWLSSSNTLGPSLWLGPSFPNAHYIGRSCHQFISDAVLLVCLLGLLLQVSEKDSLRL